MKIFEDIWYGRYLVQKALKIFGTEGEWLKKGAVFVPLQNQKSIRIFGTKVFT